MCPDINVGFIDRALNQLSKEGLILKISGGRMSSYVMNTKEKNNVY